MQAVLETDAKLSIAHDRRLVAEAHARRDLRHVALHEVRPLVPIETDTVPSPMRQAWHLVPRTVARVGYHLSGGRIHGFARRANLRCFERRALRLLFEIPDLPHLVRRPAENGRACDVSRIALDRASAVDEHDIILLQRLRLYAAMWEGGVLPEDD